MARCDNTLLDRLEIAVDIVSFLCESLTAAREVPYSGTAMCGAMYIFSDLEKELLSIRDSLTK